MIISFIIPVYNTQEYVEKCLLSIINQNIPEDEYEIIVVDDGSTDGSPKILSDFENRYSTIRVITQENRGLGAARNVAMRIAKGDYIFFVDSDDYILPDTIPDLLYFTKRNKNADIICFNTLREIEGKQRVHIDRSYIKEDVISGEDYLNKYNLYPSPCSYLISNKFIYRNSILMPEGIFHEDELFTLIAFAKAKQISPYTAPIYVNFKRLGSITNNPDSKKQKKLIDDFQYVIKELDVFYKEEDLSKLQKKGIQRRLVCLSVETIIRLSRMPFERDFCTKILDGLIELDLFPLPERKDSWKHELLRSVFKTKRRALFILRLKPMKLYKF